MSRLCLSLAAATLLFSASAMAMPSSQDSAPAVRSLPAPQLAETRTIIGGCPYNLDKVCTRHRGGRWHCHCQS